ncbi:MAG: dihydroneopterin aldolase family protein [Methanobacterium sp.]|nr:dihydroneopterin aldolase family protein [Methanobacterium sp.]
MDNEQKYFKNISNRERAIFEGAITMGALFHQFDGTPINKKTVESLEKAISEAMELQPCIDKVEVHINRQMLEKIENEFQYISLNGNMMDIRIFSNYEGQKAIIRMKYIEELDYPLMYVEKAD